MANATTAGSQLNVMGVVRDFHTVISRYTDFVIKDISQKYNLDYKEMADRYIVKCSRSIRSKASANSRQIASKSKTIDNNNK